MGEDIPMAFELPEKPKPEPSPAKKWHSAFKIVTAAARFKVPEKVDEVLNYMSLRSAARRPRPHCVMNDSVPVGYGSVLSLSPPVESPPAAVLCCGHRRSRC